MREVNEAVADILVGWDPSWNVERGFMEIYHIG
jgi:hypothetical protein